MIHFTTDRTVGLQPSIEQIENNEIFLFYGHNSKVHVNEFIDLCRRF